MNVMTLLDKLNFDGSYPVAIIDPNFERTLFIGRLDDVTFEYLKKTVREVIFKAGSNIYKEEELFYTFAIVLDI